MLALLGLVGLSVHAPAAPRPPAGVLSFVTHSVPVGGLPRRIAAGDLDGDGDPDLMTLGRAPHAWSLTVVINNGAQGFAPGWSFSEPLDGTNERLDLELADANADGDLDAFLIVASSPFLRMNAGNATFDQLGSIPAFAGRGEQEPADLDGDSDIDIVYDELDIIPYLGGLEKVGTGWQFDFSTETFFSGSYSQELRMTLADLAGDGAPDALLASPDTKGLQLVRASPQLPEMPDWGPGAQTLLTVACHDVVAGDLDADGDDDAVVSSENPVSVRVLLGQHGSPSAATAYRAGPSPDALVLADIDGDGALDAAVTQSAGTDLAVLLGNGLGGLKRPIYFAAGGDPSGLAAADFDGDGDVDLGLAGGVTGNVLVLENQLIP
jgi:hypothetical protein